MTDMVDRIADCLVEDHIKLMHENKALRDQIEIMNKEFDKYLDAVIKAEREACVRACNTVIERMHEEGEGPTGNIGWVKDCIYAIRARGKA